jgi:purine-binding chemotaxis protein CheW
MVDLAKIRKKAKKAQESAAEPVSVPADPAATDPASSSGPPATSGEARILPQSVPQSGGEAAVGLPDGDAGEPGVSKLARFKEKAGKRRDVQEVRTEEQAAEVLVELLTFVIGAEHYAVDIERIVEIVTPRPLTRVPNADATVVGIISLRGTIVTLVDVRGKLRHPPAGPPTADTRIIVIDFHNETVGFVVDRVQRVVKIAASDVEPHPVVHTTELEESIRGVFRVAGALTILLDLDKLLDHTHGPDL